MLFITNNQTTEPCLESNYEKYEEQNGQALQISFSSFSFENNIGHDLLDFNVLVEDEDGHQYKVKNITERVNSKDVVATHIYYDLIGNRKYDQFAGNATFDDFANWLFIGTDWSFINEDITGIMNLSTFGNDNFISLLQKLITRFDCEMQILPNKVIRFAKRIGRDNEKQYRYKSNIQSISRNVDTTNVRTRIRAYGAEGLTTLYTSPLSTNPLFGLLDAEPVTDDSITSETQLIQFARDSLNDIPETNIEVSVVDTDGEVGDYVWLIHEELNLEYQVRILSKKTRRDYDASEVEIGNTIRRTIEDAIIDQKTEVKENKEEAEQALGELEEKTDRELATLTVGQNEIRLEVSNVENTLRSEIVQTASSIRLQVEEVDRSVASLEITANQIQSNVTNLQNQTNSSITQLSNSINLKVDKGGVITDINLTPGTATINADKINLNGAVMVNGNITGSSNINISNNISIGNAIYFGSSGLNYIDLSSGNMSFNSWGKFVFNGAIGVDVYGELRVNGKKVLTEA